MPASGSRARFYLGSQHLRNNGPELVVFAGLDQSVVPALQLAVAQLLVQGRDMRLQVHQRLGLRKDLILDVLSHHLSPVVDLGHLSVQVGGVPEHLLQLRNLLLSLKSPLLLGFKLLLKLPLPSLGMLQDCSLVLLNEPSGLNLN